MTEEQEVPPEELTQRIKKLLFEDDFKDWRQKEGWRYHNECHYWYKLQYISEWPPLNKNVKDGSELESEFLSQYESAYVNEYLTGELPPNPSLNKEQGKGETDWEGAFMLMQEKFIETHKQLAALKSQPSFTREDMEGFAEWTNLSSWVFIERENYWSLLMNPDKITTSQLLDNYLKTIK